MGSDTDNKNGTERLGNNALMRVRVAYSINNYQPVLCTHISDQPFFYLDDEAEFEEEGFELLDREISDLQHKMESYETFSAGFTQKEDENFLEFMADSHVIGDLTYTPDNEDILARITEALSASRMATKLLKFAKRHDVNMVCTDHVETALYDKQSDTIFVRSSMSFLDQVLLTVQELRRHWQYRQGADVHPLTFHPDQAILINRSQIADLNAAMVRCAWELRLNGQKEFWERIENSSIADLGRAFAREALTDFRTLNNGKASAAVFETWFLSERCREQDKKLIQTMLADYNGYVFDSAEASKMVSIELITALGEQPFGKNYLAPYAQMIMNDPVFTEVRDRSNANFLWFIKFERSFMETERELQSSSQNQKSDIHQAKHNDIIEDTNHEGHARRRSTDDRPLFNGQNNVIHVAFGADAKTLTGIQS
jgi:hypothetical protein